MRIEFLFEDRFEAQTGCGLTPLVGRNTEVSLLIERWTEAKDGEGRVVLLSGEPGIGKSRLASELGRSIRNTGYSVATAQCYEAGGRLPWGPVVELLRSNDIQSQIDELDEVWKKELSRKCCLLHCFNLK